MFFSESINVSGQVHIVVTDKNGDIKSETNVPNLIVTTGKNHIAARIFANYILWTASTAATLNTLYYYGNNIYKCTTAGTFNTVAPSHSTGAVANGTATLTWYSLNDSSLVTHIGFGTSTTTPVLTDTDIISIIGSRASANLTHLTGTNSMSASATLTGSAGTITEAGMFNALTAGTMICRTTFAGIPILTTDSLAITWIININ